MKYTPTLLTALLLAPPASFRAAEAPKPRNGEKIIFINDDGFSSFYSGRRNPKRLDWQP